MKHTAALIACLFLLLLGSPLLGQENPVSPITQGPATEGATLSFMNQATQSAPQCAASTLFTDLSMTAKQCALTCEGCCACAAYDGNRCLDWQCC